MVNYFYDFLKNDQFSHCEGPMTLKMTFKVKFDIWFGGFGYRFGVVYYSMLLPKTIISGWISQGHQF